MNTLLSRHWHHGFDRRLAALKSNLGSVRSFPLRKAAHVRILKGPELGSSHRKFDHLSGGPPTNPGGSPDHFGVVHYGTDPKNLRETAKSHIR